MYIQSKKDIVNYLTEDNKTILIHTKIRGKYSQHPLVNLTKIPCPTVDVQTLPIPQKYFRLLPLPVSRRQHALIRILSNMYILIITTDLPILDRVVVQPL